ncbi:MAG: DUF1501 domain-containing protein [Saprospiraceae bacterium]|nr:DUF1501 domain-containing protein [Saprospiraceae bacterium]
MNKSNKVKSNLTRRQFVGSASCAAIGSTTLLSSLLNLGTSNALAGLHSQSTEVEGEYKALVCILLAGGNDSFNMLVPNSKEPYQEYRKSRSNLALTQSSLLPLQFSDPGGREYAVHPSMPEVQHLFNTHKLAFIANVGTLVEPVSKAKYLAGSAKLPIGLLSHADQIQQWQTSLPDSRSAKGWGGRIADLLEQGNKNQNISMNISLSGTNVFQVGSSATEYAIRAAAGGSVGIRVYEGNSQLDRVLRKGTESLLAQQYQDIFKSTFQQKILHAQANHGVFSHALASVAPLQSPFSANDLSADLALVAQTIAARKALGMKRQTFFINYGGWDHHDSVLENQAQMLSILSKALQEFQSAIDELGISQQVTTFTISDFGRTLSSNGNGTDHAWGGNVMVMGGAVKGGNIYGKYPSLRLGGSDDIGGAILLPSLSTDMYFAELARWFGVSKGDLSFVLPNINRFYDPRSSSLPIGFMND